MLDIEIERLYRQYGHYLYSRCRNLLGSDDEAYDALQEVFVRVIKARDKLDRKQTPLPWLNRVTTNICLNRLRARRHRTHLSLTHARELADCAPHVFVARIAEQKDLLSHLLDGADSRTLEVVASYFLDGRTAAQIGDDIGASAPTVRRILKRFLDSARAKVEQHAGAERSSTSKVYP